MKKMFKKLSLAASVAVSVGMAGQAMAVVAESTSGQGDLQFVPVSVLAGGWQTKISLINSSTTQSTVSKAVIRSSANSRECLDFFVYLSPGDRMEGTFMEASSLPEGITGPGTDLVFYSTDDSVVASLDATGAAVMATAAAPAVYAVQDVDGGCGISYVEIIESASYSLGAAVVSKPLIFATDAAQTAGAPNTLNAPVNTISGSYTLLNSTNGVTMSDQMDVYTGYGNTVYLDRGNNTTLGRNTTDGMAAFELAMDKQNIKSSYEHDNVGELSIVSITFPTKMDFDTLGNVSTYTPLNNSGNPSISTTVRDMSEVIMACANQSTTSSITSPVTPPTVCSGVTEGLSEEANLIVVSAKIQELADKATAAGGQANPAGFTKGWININLQDDGNAANGTGAPVLTRLMQFSLNSLGALDGTLKGLAND